MMSSSEARPGTYTLSTELRCRCPWDCQPFNVKGTVDQGFPEIAAGLAYWKPPSATTCCNSVYTWANGDLLRSFSLSGQNLQQGPDSNATEQGIPISISSFFDDANTGLVWAVVPPYGSDPHNDYDPKKNPDAIHEFVSGTLNVYNASALSQRWSYPLGGNYIVKFTPPLVANGKVYVVTVKNVNGTPSGPQIMVFGK
jgi:hypothetical protein